MPSILDSIMQNPASILGLSVLSNNKRPAEGLLQGSLLQNKLANQRQVLQNAQTRDQMNKLAIARAQQDSKNRLAIQEGRKNLFGQPGTPIQGPLQPGAQRPLGGGAGILADAQITPQEAQNAIPNLLAVGDIQGANAMNQYLNATKSGAGTSAFERAIAHLPPEQQARELDAWRRKQTHISPATAPAPYYSSTPTTEGLLMVNSRNPADRSLVPWPEGSEGPIKYDPSRRGDIAYESQIGTGTAEQVTDPETARLTDIAERSAEKQITRSKADSALSSQMHKAGLISDTIDLAVDQSGVWTSGFIGSATSFIPGTPAHDLSNTLNTVKANIGFDRLRELKDAGGTLGQVSDRENTLLQQTWSSVEQSQSPAQLKRNLQKVKDQVRKSWERVETAYNKEYGAKTVFDEADAIIGD